MTFKETYDFPLLTDAVTDNGEEISVGDELQLIFNEGTHKEHKGLFSVVWEKGSFWLLSESGLFSPIHGISNNVKVIKNE